MKKGFTLIELLVVVLIIGILAAVALPQYQKAVDRSYAVEMQSVARSMAHAMQMYELANGTYPADLEDLEMDYPWKSCFTGEIKSCLVTDRVRIEYGSHNGEWTARMVTPFSCGLYGVKGNLRVCIGTGERGKKLCQLISGESEPYGTAENGSFLFHL